MGLLTQHARCSQHHHPHEEGHRLHGVRVLFADKSVTYVFSLTSCAKISHTGPNELQLTESLRITAKVGRCLSVRAAEEIYTCCRTSTYYELYISGRLLGPGNGQAMRDSRRPFHRCLKLREAVRQCADNCNNLFLVDGRMCEMNCRNFQSPNCNQTSIAI